MSQPRPGSAHDTANIERFMQQIRNTLLFQVEWPELLSPGPRAMSNMGACFLAARATNPYLSLVGSLDSAHGLEYTTLIASVLLVSEKGINAFHLAHRRMSTIYQISESICTSLDEIANDISHLPNAGYLSLLRAKLGIFSGSTNDSSKYCLEVENAFVGWGATIGELRRAVLDKQDAIPPPIIRRPPPPIPSLPSPEASVIASMFAASTDQEFWRNVPHIEASIRRLYKLVTYTPDGDVDWAFLRMPAPNAYVTILHQRLTTFVTILQGLGGANPGYLAPAIDATSDCMQTALHLRDNRTEYQPYMPQWRADIFKHWGLFHTLIEAANLHFQPSALVDTWDPTDMMDALYYPPRLPTPAPIAVPAPQYDPNSLMDITSALAEVRSESRKLVRFFAAVSTTGQNIVDVHVRSFKFSANQIMRRAEANEVTEVERADLIKSARSVKSYFLIIRAVALMYRHIHLNYFETGVDLLGDVSRASTDAVRAARQKALAGYSQRVSTELATYIENKKRLIILELRTNITDMFGGCSKPAEDNDDEWNNT